MPERPDAATVPMTVIGGFLGAGKTTLLNHILSRAEARCAVLVNDFGAVNLDASLIADHDGQTLKLTNGCVCCSLGSGLIETLIGVLDAEPPFDHILIEASGVADPWLIAEIALVEPVLRLNAVIVLAEAQRLSALLEDPRVGDTVAAQVRAADILVLNKADLADEGARVRARAAAAAIKPKLHAVETVNAELPLGLLDLEAAPRSGGTAMFRADAPSHETIFRRFLYRRRGAFRRDRLERSLETLPTSLLRLKGICRMIGEPRPMVLQMVGPRFVLSPASQRSRAGWPIELVGIGVNTMPEDEAFGRVLDGALEPRAPAMSLGEC
ncbi:MAG: CobW family GTP-binding protein [Hyphomicrobiales bacterium]